MKKFINILFPIAIMLVWIMPVSNQLNTMNEGLIRICYLMNILILLSIWLYERILYKEQLTYATIIMGILFVCTVLTCMVNPDNPSIGYGYLFNYLPFCILINIIPKKIINSKLLDYVFDVVCFLLITVGILIVIKNDWITQLLQTYYVNHYEWLYPGMLKAKKTVTFFATHSLACYYYFILWWLADYRMKYKKDIKTLIIIIGIIFLIAMCKSTSALLCIGIIITIYFIRLLKKKSKTSITILSLGLLIILIAICLNWSTIMDILGSNSNGLSGRFGSEGNLNSTLKYMMFQIPLGLCNVDNLWLTDGGFFVNFVRGGILLVIVYFLAFYKFLSKNILDKDYRNILFISIMLFEVGFQVTMSMRSFMVIIFAVIYFRSLYKRKPITENDNVGVDK